MGLMSIKMESSGHFKRLEKHLQSMKRRKVEQMLQLYGPIGVQALSSATPERSGKTASSWSYRIESANGSTKIVWTNSNVNEGVPIAIIIQYGHGTGTGGYVPPVDYINPAMRPVFDDIEQRIREEVSKL